MTLKCLDINMLIRIYHVSFTNTDVTEWCDGVCLFGWLAFFPPEIV